MTLEVAMFPLGSVLLPGSLLPLHIFEDRYRRMIHDVLEDDCCFGVAFITRGSEVGGGEERSAVGVMATIVEATRFDDGRWAIGAVADRRFKVIEWLVDDPYPRARIEWWPEVSDDAPSSDGLDHLLDLIAGVGAMGEALGYTVPVVQRELPADSVALSYALTSVSPLGPLDRFDLLCADGPRQRLELLEQRLLDQQVLFGAQISMEDGTEPEL
jgi:Lon protease-like protein